MRSTLVAVAHLQGAVFEAERLVRAGEAALRDHERHRDATVAQHGAELARAGDEHERTVAALRAEHEAELGRQAAANDELAAQSETIRRKAIAAAKGGSA